MKLAAICLMSALTAGAACADWTYVGRVEKDFYYVDESTIRRFDGMTTAWVMANKNERDDVIGAHSMQTRMQFDCKNQRVRWLYILAFSEPMGTGKLLVNDSIKGERFMDASPGSSLEAISERVCP